MKNFLFPFSILFFITIHLQAQVNYSANDKIPRQRESFRVGMNPGFYGNEWNDYFLTDVAAGNAAAKLPGIGVQSFRTALHEKIALVYDYKTWENIYKYYSAMGIQNNTVIVGLAHPDHADPTQYCEGTPTEMFANLYEPIFDDGKHGTPINENNYFARYMWDLLETIGDHVQYWEIWNEPGFDYTGAKGWLEKGQPGNWWENNPEPCDYKLRAPIFHYVRTLRIAYEVIKTHSPNDFVVVSGVGYDSFLDAILRNTDNPDQGKVTSEYPLKGGAYFDVMGFHSAPHFDGSMRKWSNEVGGFVYNRHSDQGVDGFLEKKSARSTLLANYGYNGNQYPSKKFMITEFNVPKAEFEDASGTNTDYFGSEEGARNFIMKSIITAHQEGLLQIHPYQLSERVPLEKATGPYDRMGFFKNFNEVRPYDISIYEQGIAYQTTNKILNGKTFDPDQSKKMQLPDGIKGGAFKDRSGNHIYVLWAKTKTDQSEKTSATYSFPIDFRLEKVEKLTWDYLQNRSQSFIEPKDILLDGTPIFFIPSKMPSSSIELICTVDSTDIGLKATLAEGGTVFKWEKPNGKTTCPNGGLKITQIQGLISGSVFPIGMNIITYEAKDACGNITRCGFTIQVNTEGEGAGNKDVGCPIFRHGFRYIGSFKGHKYFVSKDKMTFEEGQKLANRQGGYLVSIDSEEENQHLVNWNQAMAIIGLNDLKKEGSAHWDDGESLSFQNFETSDCTWCEGNSKTNDVVEFHPWNGKWNWIAPSEKREVIIEIPCYETVGCDCDKTTESVCGTDGKTYSSACEAECAGVFNYSYGKCSEETDCQESIEGFKYLGNFEGNNYFLSNEISRPTDAQVKAESYGGYLVQIGSKEENAFIQKNISEMIYIGMNDYKEEGKLVWTNGEPVNYQNIEPCDICNKNSERMDFVIMAPWNGKWSFSNFYNNRKYVIEVPCRK